MSEYYAFLSSLTNLVSPTLSSLEATIGIPIVTALILGLIGSTSPCQLTTNVAALAFVSRETSQTRRIAGSALAYLMGKITVYSLLGIVVIVAGAQMSSLAVPAVVVVRKALGPVLILVGLLMLGVLRLNLAFGKGLSAWLEERAGKKSRLSSFLLGAAFALVFCPTLFWLFFGLVMPLSLASPEGILFPSVFALGTTLPLLALAGLIALGVKNVNKYIHQMKRIDFYIYRVAGIIFILVGINEMIVYWLW